MKNPGVNVYRRLPPYSIRSPFANAAEVLATFHGAAIRGGHSVDTTMGFTPLEDLMMGTRSGSIDPGILTFLMRDQKLSGEQLDDLLNKKSGLLGISGISSDMREIVAAIKQGI